MLEWLVGVFFDMLFLVLQDCVGNVWVGIVYGLYVGCFGVVVFKWVECGDVVVWVMLFSDIWVLCEDVVGVLWVGIGLVGVVVFGFCGKVCLLVVLGVVSLVIQWCIVWDILFVFDGWLWIVIDGIGIVCFDLCIGEISVLCYDLGWFSLFGGDIVCVLFLDCFGGLWVVIELIVLCCDICLLIVYMLDGCMLFGLQGVQIDQNVCSVFIDCDGIVWLGFNCGYVVVVDLVYGCICMLELFGYQVDQDICVIVQLDDGCIVVGVCGLVIIDFVMLVVVVYLVDGLDGKFVFVLVMYWYMLMVGVYDGFY